MVFLIIPNIDSIEKFEDVFKNYKTDFTVVDNNLYDDENQTEIDKTYCACGHKVKSNNVYNLINNTTGYNLLIGCDCIDKYKIFSQEELKVLKQKRKIQTKNQGRKLLFLREKRWL